VNPRQHYQENHLKGYTIFPNTFNQIRKDYGLTKEASLIMYELFTYNNENHFTSKSQVAKEMDFDRDATARAIESLKKHNFLVEIKKGKFCRYRVIIPLCYKSIWTTDKHAGKKDLKIKINLASIKWIHNYENLSAVASGRLINLSAVASGRLINRHAVQDGNIESQTLQSQNKKSQKQKPDSSFRMLLKKWKHEHQLRCVLSYIMTHRTDILNPYGCLNSPNFTQKHFDEFYGKYLETQTEANRNEHKSNPVDLEGINQMVVEQDDDGPMIDLENISVTPQEEALAKQAIEEMMLNLKKQMIINEVELTD
jgi:hypothetical protein